MNILHGSNAPTGLTDAHAATSGRVGAIVIFLLTLVYLCLELPFSADLLDGVGSVITPQQLQHLEIAGRLISGLALVLLIWQFVVLPLSRLWGRRQVRTVVVCLVITIPVMIGVYRGEGALVSRQSSNDGAAARQMALATVLFAQGVERGQVDIKGLPFTASTRQDPDAMTFMALLPLMAAQMHDIRSRLMPIANAMVRQRLEAETGGAEAFYDHTYMPAMQRARDMYARYRDGMQAYNRGYERYQHGLAQYQKAATKADQLGDQAYWSYRKQLARAIRSSGPAPAWECPTIRVRANRKYGINLPRDWNCWAKAPFAQAVAAHIRDEDRRKLTAAQQELSRHHPTDMGATFDAFLREPKVQSELLATWKQAGIAVPTGTSLSRQTVDSWGQLVYEPMLDAQATGIVNHFVGHVDDFRQGGSYYQKGRDAHELLVIPAIALFFSLLGALVHIVKIIVEASVIILPHKFVYWKELFVGRWRQAIRNRAAFVLRMGFFVTGVVLVSVPIVLTTPVTRSPVFESITQAMRAGTNGSTTKSGAMSAAFAKWAIQTEAAVYPFNAKLRNAIDQAFDFEQSWLVRTIAQHSAPLSSPLGVSTANRTNPPDPAK